jgi:ribonuclease HII
MPDEIDRLNILEATMLAMRQAVEALGVAPAVILIDGNRAPSGLKGQVITVVKGDQSEASIAAASIIAKVERDSYMLEMDAAYPGYGFAQHKGYPTADHYAALRAKGPTPIHRRTFKGVVV